MAIIIKNKNNKRTKVWDKTNGRCIYCGIKLNKETYHMEHVIPRWKQTYNNGGIDSLDMLWPACHQCNLFKGDLTVDEYRGKLYQVLETDARTRMIKKIYNLKPKIITFWFEKQGIEIIHEGVV